MSNASGISPPPVYDTNTDPNTNPNFNIQIIWDSSVANAPPSSGSPGSPGFVPGFVYDVEQVADFYATELQSSTPITITIDVGYGEINGNKIGNSALGESETNLQLVTSPNGNYYLSDAQAQALGVQLTNPQTVDGYTVDGYIGFSSKSNTFDYNTNIFSTVGSTGGSLGSNYSNQYDFEGTVAHEMSEVLGREFLSGKTYSDYDAFFHYSSPGVHDFAANGSGYFSNNEGTTDLGNFNTAHGGDGADWGAGGTGNIVGGSTNDAFNAFGTPGQITPVSYSDLAVLGALGYTLTTTAATEAAEAQPVGPALTQTTVQNTVNSPPGNSSSLDQQVALFNQFMAAGFPEQHGGQITTNAPSQVTTNEQQFLAAPHHG